VRGLSEGDSEELDALNLLTIPWKNPCTCPCIYPWNRYTGLMSRGMYRPKLEKRQTNDWLN
jgi:hypothetical protein